MRVPRQTISKSKSVIVKVASAFLSSPTFTTPYPFFKSIIQVFFTGPPFFSVIQKLNTAATLPIKGLASPNAMYCCIILKIPSLFNPLDCYYYYYYYCYYCYYCYYGCCYFYYYAGFPALILSKFSLNLGKTSFIFVGYSFSPWKETTSFHL